MRIDKRADRVISWLERMKTSYLSGRLESAYFDAECARADLEDLRMSVFSSVVPRKKSIIPFVQAAILSLAVIFADVQPLSRELPVNISENISENAPKNISANISGNAPKNISAKLPVNISVKTPENISNSAVPAKIPAKPGRIRHTSSKKKAQETPRTPQEKTVPEKTAPQKKVAQDKLIYLLQAGQRAMKKNATVIKIK